MLAVRLPPALDDAAGGAVAAARACASDGGGGSAPPNSGDDAESSSANSRNERTAGFVRAPAPGPAVPAAPTPAGARRGEACADGAIDRFCGTLLEERGSPPLTGSPAGVLPLRGLLRPGETPWFGRDGGGMRDGVDGGCEPVGRHSPSARPFILCGGGGRGCGAAVTCSAPSKRWVVSPAKRKSSSYRSTIGRTAIGSGAARGAAELDAAVALPARDSVWRGGAGGGCGGAGAAA